jgi:hypothetical protein
MQTIDFGKTHKQVYTATRKIQEVTADAGTFLAVEGQGAPGGETFQKAIQALYSTAYTLKFTLKMQGTLDFKVGKLHCLYLSDPAKVPMDQWQWRMLLQIPEEVTAKDLTEAKKAIREKKGLDASGVRRIRWKEGRAVYVLHVGPYDQVGDTYRALGAYAAEHGLNLAGPAHEIYLNDPRRTAPEKLKTIVRLPVKKG